MNATIEGQGLVIGLSGPSGSGKTTAARMLVQRIPGLRHVAYDDFQTVTAMPLDKLEAWYADGGDCNSFVLTELEDELDRRLRAEEAIVVFETPLGRTHRGTARFIDRLVWIDTPLDIALARAVHKAVTDALRRHRSAEDLLRWLDTYLAIYQRVVATMYRRQAEQIRSDADLVVDGTQPPETVAAAIAAYLETLTASRPGPHGR